MTIEQIQTKQTDRQMPAPSDDFIAGLVRDAFNAGYQCGRASARCEIYQQEPVIDLDGTCSVDGADCPF